MSLSSRINVTPYIDILLVLLIIFMTLQPQMRHDLRSRTPQEAEESVKPSRIPLVLRIDGDFRLRLAGVEVKLPQLGESLRRKLSARREKTLFVQAPSDIDYGTVVRLIDIAKGAGVSDFGLLNPTFGSGSEVP